MLLFLRGCRISRMNKATDIYAKAEAELSDIDSQIAALEKRRVELRHFVELGRRLFGADSSDSSKLLLAIESAKTVAVNPPARRMIFRRDTSMKSRIHEIARRVVAEHGPTHTRDLIPFIEAEGVEITGSDKMVTVSVILSRSEDFKADRSVGWTLVNQPHKEVTPQDVAASEGSDL